MRDETDADLIARVARGDRRAMRTLYERHAEAATRFARRYLADPVAAADAVHEAMLVVWTRAERYDRRSAGRTWILGIVRYKALDLARRAARMPVAEAEDTLADDAPGPAEAAALASDARAVRAAMKTLSPPHRAVLHLAFYEELPYPEIAEIEGIPLGTVKTRVLHAKRRLARALAEGAAGVTDR